MGGKLNQCGISRREFILKAGMTGIGGIAFFAGCAAPSQNITKPEQFNIKQFERWYRANKLYNGPNPNLRSPHSPSPYSLGGLVAPIFKDTIQKQVTPGLTYEVPAGEIMVAVAPGTVSEIGEITGTGRAGGMYVHISHPSRVSPIPYISFFAHVSSPIAKIGQKVERGQPICTVPLEHSRYAKLILYELGNHIDPDNYGLNHSYMDYWDGKTNLEIENPFEKLQKQIAIAGKLERAYQNPQILFGKTHGHPTEPSAWSWVEKFRFLSTMYEMYPVVFPELKKEEFETMKKEFYANQPIILTLPFKKGGLR